jgi:hypothetical protein
MLAGKVAVVAGFGDVGKGVRPFYQSQFPRGLTYSFLTLSVRSLCVLMVHVS